MNYIGFRIKGEGITLGMGYEQAKEILNHIYQDLLEEEVENGTTILKDSGEDSMFTFNIDKKLFSISVLRETIDSIEGCLDDSSFEVKDTIDLSRHGFEIIPMVYCSSLTAYIDCTHKTFAGSGEPVQCLVEHDGKRCYNCPSGVNHGNYAYINADHEIEINTSVDNSRKMYITLKV